MQTNQTPSIKPKFSIWKSIGKGLISVGKGALVLAPILLEEVVPILKDNGVTVAKWIVVTLGVVKAVNNARKNKDN